MPIWGYEIGLGWDLPDGSLTNIESISVPNTVLTLNDIVDRYELDASTHYLPSARTNPEQNRVTLADGTSAQQGYERKILTLAWASDVGFQYWIDTYGGKKVTIKTTKRAYNDYTKYNAIAGFPELRGEINYTQGTWWYNDIDIPFMLAGTVA